MAKTFRVAAILLVTVGLGLVSGMLSAKPDGAMQAHREVVTVSNPVFHFEIPVTNLDRAVRFYERALDIRLTRRTVDGYEMAFFPRADGKPGASGALAMGDVYVPSKTGAVIYFDVPDIDQVLERARELGAVILYPKKDIGADGYVAEIEDSEGNRLALTAVKDTAPGNSR